MDNTNLTLTIRKHDEALEEFCEKKIGLYHQSFKESIDSCDWHKLQKISHHLAQDSETLGAVQFIELAAKLIETLKDPYCNEKQVRLKVDCILNGLQLLKNEYRDYLETTYVCKKINILSTLTTVQHVEPELGSYKDYNIDEEFNNHWQCMIQ
jgi:hypothetical protein